MTKEQRKTYPFAALLTDARVLTENLKDFKRKYRSRTKTQKILERARGCKLLEEAAGVAIDLEELAADVCAIARLTAYAANLEADNRDIKSK